MTVVCVGVLVDSASLLCVAVEFGRAATCPMFIGTFHAFARWFLLALVSKSRFFEGRVVSMLCPVLVESPRVWSWLQRSVPSPRSGNEVSPVSFPLDFIGVRVGAGGLLRGDPGLSAVFAPGFIRYRIVVFACLVSCFVGVSGEGRSGGRFRVGPLPQDEIDFLGFGVGARVL